MPVTSMSQQHARNTIAAIRDWLAKNKAFEYSNEQNERAQYSDMAFFADWLEFEGLKVIENREVPIFFLTAEYL
jgi:hypothetical protein